MNVSVTPIIPSTRERKSDGGTVPSRNPVDSKVKGVVLERISHTKGALLPSATAPQIVIDLLPVFESARMEHAPRVKKKPKLRKTPLPRSIPIGLAPSDSEGWVNALMQFVLFVPGFAELFLFAPRSFYPFQEFIDQYHTDQQEHRTLSSANGPSLFRFLSFRLPDLSPQEIFHFLARTLYPKWEIQKNFEEALKKNFPPDLFLTESQKTQLITPDHFCYDLDAFIERRPDGPSANYITYVKVDGSWYQCDDDRITSLRSNCLPLHRSILFHYRRIAFGKTGWT